MLYKMEEHHIHLFVVHREKQENEYYYNAYCYPYSIRNVGSDQRNSDQSSEHRNDNIYYGYSFEKLSRYFGFLWYDSHDVSFLFIGCIDLCFEGSYI